MSPRLKHCGSFEEASRNAPFPELIRLAVWLGGAVRRFADWADHRMEKAPQQGSRRPVRHDWRMRF